MAARIPIRFQPYGEDRAPTIEFSVRLRKTGARLNEFALLDTGSSITVFPRDLLLLHRFPLLRAREDERGIGGLGGSAKLHYLSDATFAVLDQDSAPHIVNLQRLHFTSAKMPTILGRDLLKALNGKVVIDFVEERGFIEIG